MNVHGLNRLASIVAVLVLFVVPAGTSAHDSMVKRISAETADNLVFNIWLERETVRPGQDIIVHYSVENRSAQAVYLVRDNTARPIAERGTILLQEPFVSLGGHEGYDYSFTKIDRGKRYENQLIIPKESYQAQPWRIDVGFGYVTDITGLDRQVGHGEDPSPMKVQLHSRIKTLSLGSLGIEVLRD